MPNKTPAEPRPAGSGFLDQTRALFIVVASTVLVYANSLGGAFVFDDKKQVLRNARIHSWSNLLAAFSTSVWDFQREFTTVTIPPVYYRPLFTIYLTVTYKLFGVWAPGWHLISVLAHVGATVFVFLLMRQITGKLPVAFAVALVFGVHSAHVESVAWVAAIPDPMMALFLVPALMWYDRFRTGGARKHLALSVLFYAFALMSKETAVSLPVIVACWELLRGRLRTKRGFINSALMFAPYAAISAAYLAARVAVLGTVSWKHPAMLSIPDHLIWMTVPYSLVGYLRHLLVPFDLSIVYGTSYVSGATDPRFYVPALVLAALAALLFKTRRLFTRDAWLALAFMLCPLLPVLNLKALHQEYVIQDRYLYLSVLGFAWLLTSLAARAQRARRFLPAALAVAAVALGAGTVIQNRVWGDSVALWQNAVRHAPDFWTTHYNLGTAYMDGRDYDGAMAEFRASLSIHPTSRAYNNMAMTQLRTGDKGGAEQSLRAALAVEPLAYEPRNNLGTLLYDRGDYRTARAQFQLAVMAEPTSADARFNLARASAALGDHAAAVREYQAVLAKNPADAEARQQLEASRQALAQNRPTSN